MIERRIFPTEVICTFVAELKWRKMEVWIKDVSNWFITYCNSFKNLSEEQKRNFEIKKAHSLRVANLSMYLADKLDFNIDEKKLAFFIGVFHDIGRFKQVVEFNTFDDSKSVDHAKYSIQVITEEKIFENIGIEGKDLALEAIFYHNKFKLHENLSEQELKFAKLIRDADKIDILKVLTDYYSSRDSTPNHTLTWELPQGMSVSTAVAKEVLEGKLVSKKDVASVIDVKIMQMSWVYDFNYRLSFEYVLKKRFLEIIYETLPKNDLVIEIHRKIKVYSENKIYGKYKSG